MNLGGPTPPIPVDGKSGLLPTTILMILLEQLVNSNGFFWFLMR